MQGRKYMLPVWIKKSFSGVLLIWCFFVINVCHGGPYGPIASRGGRGGGSIPEFLRKPIATCEFPGVVRTPQSPPSGFADV